MPHKRVNIGFQPDDNVRWPDIAAGQDITATGLVRALASVDSDAKAVAARDLASNMASDHAGVR